MPTLTPRCAVSCPRWGPDMADMVTVREFAGSWSYTVVPEGATVGAYGWADSEAEAWQRVAALRGEG